VRGLAASVGGCMKQKPAAAAALPTQCGAKYMHWGHLPATPWTTKVAGLLRQVHECATAGGLKLCPYPVARPTLQHAPNHGRIRAERDTPHGDWAGGRVTRSPGHRLCTASPADQERSQRPAASHLELLARSSGLAGGGFVACNEGLRLASPRVRCARRHTAGCVHGKCLPSAQPWGAQH
jgi:hypothetical protein